MAERMLNYTAKQINEILAKAKAMPESGVPGPTGPAGPTGPQGPAGEDGRDGQDGKDAENPNFTASATTLASTSAATAEVYGVYPNLELKFGIPKGKDGGGGGGSSVEVIDELTSYDKENALSANMGRVLNTNKAEKEHVHSIYEIEGLDYNLQQKANKIHKHEISDVNDLQAKLYNIEDRIDSIEQIDVVDNLESTDPEKALSANQGRILGERTLTEEQKENVAKIPNLEEGLGSVISEMPNKANIEDIPEVLDVLDSTESTKALSANQGRYLYSLIEGGGGSSSDYIAVTSIGTKTGNESGIKEANTEILKQYIDEKSTSDPVKTFYFPRGEYYFDFIEITDTSKTYKISLYGEELENGTNPDGVKIYTSGQSFIVRTNTTGNNAIKFDVKNMAFYSCTQTSEKALGTCFGVSSNLNKSYSFNFKNVKIFGYQYGFYTPKNANGSKANGLTLEHCVYGIYIKDNSETFVIDDITLKNCLYGMRFFTCNNDTKISNIYIHCGFYSGLDSYADSDKKSYAIHTKGGGIFDTINWTKSGSPTINSFFRIIEYQGRIYDEATPVIIRNMSIKTVYGNAKILVGGCYSNATPEEKPSVWSGVSAERRLTFLPYGCIRFENCLENNTVTADKLESLFSIDGGKDVLEGWGFYFAEKELVGHGLGMANTVITRFKSYFNIYGHSENIEMYSYNDIPDEYKIFNGNRIQDSTPVYTGISGAHITGTITINNLNAYDIDGALKGPDLCIVGKENQASAVSVFNKLFSIDKNCFGKDVTIVVDEFISCEDLYTVFLGYQLDTAIKLTEQGTQKVIYNLEIESSNAKWQGWQSNSRSYWFMKDSEEE